MRIFDTPELFGMGCGSGTCGDIQCDMCKTKYNQGNDKSENYSGDSILHTDFAGIQVCECCFEKIENEVLLRMPDILKWYRQILNSKKKNLKEKDMLLRRVE